MRHLVCLTLFFFSLFFAHGQQSSLSDDPLASSFAMPGVVNRSPGKGLVIENRLQSGFEMDGASGRTQDVSYNHIQNYKLKIPFVLKQKLTVLGGVQYQKERYFFDNDGAYDSDLLFRSLNSSALKTTRFSLYVTKSINEKFYLAFRGEAMYLGNYQRLSGDLGNYSDYRAAAVLGFKPNTHKEFGFGLMYAQNFRQTRILPVVYMNQTFSDKWGMELILPVKLKARYNINSRSLLLVGSDFESRTYSISSKQSDEGAYYFHFRRAALSLNLTYQYNLKSWVWIEAKSGYNMSFDNRVDDPQKGSTARLGQTNSAFVTFGIFASPTKKK